MHLALEQLQPDDGVDGDHEEHKQGDVEQGQHGLEDGVEDHLQACGARGQGEREDLAPLLVSWPSLGASGTPRQEGAQSWGEGEGLCHPLGTPDTSRSGLSTRKALRALTSKPAPLLLMGAVLLWMMLTCSRITVKTLRRTRGREDGPAVS